MRSCGRNRDKLLAADGQALAAFRAAAFEHQPPIFRAHTHQETVRFGAVAGVGLKRTLAFHRSLSLSRTVNVSERVLKVSIEVVCVTVGVLSSSR